MVKCYIEIRIPKNSSEHHQKQHQQQQNNTKRIYITAIMSLHSLSLHMLWGSVYNTEPCVFIQYFHSKCCFIFIWNRGHFMIPFNCNQYFMICYYDTGIFVFLCVFQCLFMCSFFVLEKIINAKYCIHIVRACKCFDKCHSIISTVNVFYTNKFSPSTHCTFEWMFCLAIMMEICKHTNTPIRSIPCSFNLALYNSPLYDI